MKRMLAGLLVLVFAIMMLPLQRVSMSSPDRSGSKPNDIQAKQPQEPPSKAVQSTQLDRVFPASLTIAPPFTSLAAGAGAAPVPPAFLGAQVQADVAVVKSDSPDPVVAGQNITFTVTLTNNGPSDAQLVALNDVVPGNTTFVSATQGSGPTFTPTLPPVGGTGTVTFTIAAFPIGAVSTFSIVVKVNPNAIAGANILNTANVTTSSFDFEPSNDSSSTSTLVQAQADLAVAKTDSPDPVIAGNNITYTLTLSNNGPSDAQSVTLTDPVPPNTTFFSAMQTGGPAFTSVLPPVGSSGTNVVFTIPTLAAGATATFEVVVKVHPSVVNGATITNIVTALSTTTDTNTQNNSDTETTEVIAEADVSLTKTDSPDPVFAGANIT